MFFSIHCLYIMTNKHTDHDAKDATTVEETVKALTDTHKQEIKQAKKSVPFMKTIKIIFWTSIIWIMWLVALYVYTWFFGKEVVLRLYGSDIINVTELEKPDFSTLEAKIDELNAKIDQLEKTSPATPPTVVDPADQFPVEHDVKLFFFNETVDNERDATDRANPASVMPVDRIVTIMGDDTQKLLEETLILQMEQEFTRNEQRDGFIATIPDTLTLKDVQVDDYGVAVITFEGSVGWGSANLAILESMLKQTAMQFDSIRIVELQPEELFQP